MGTLILILIFVIILSSAETAYAYVGPGIGAGTVGVILGVIASILLALFAVIWYPIKRLFKIKNRKRKTPEEVAEQ